MSRYVLTAALTLSAAAAAPADLLERVEHGYADSNGVQIHYASLGQGPLIVMIHGFPDFWYSWRYQMDELADRYRVVAIDQRGYNKSGKPKGQENYDVSLLTADVEAVITHLGEEKAIIVGHDWGGYVAWWLAMTSPARVDKLIICNLPHPKGISRELANNPEQQANSAYARALQLPGAHAVITTGSLATAPAGKDMDALKIYQEALGRSDVEAMLHYYKQNYAREPYTEDTRAMPKVKAPVLMFHGLEDKALHHNALNNTWEWVEGPLTIVTVPGAGHWVHHDAADYVTKTIADWLERH